MNKKIFFSLAALVGSLVIAPLQSNDATTYVGHDGSISPYLTKVKVEPYKKGSQYWSYIVRVYATDYPLAVAGIYLKSDIDKVSLGVNKNVAKGQCSFYCAVMKAKDGNTLGATLILKSDAVNEAQSIIAKYSNQHTEGPIDNKTRDIQPARIHSKILIFLNQFLIFLDHDEKYNFSGQYAI